MELRIPGVCFVTSSIPLEFHTDGHTTYFEPAGETRCSPAHVLAMTQIQADTFGLTSVKGISVFDSIFVPESFRAPEIYDGTQGTGGKRVLILMQNGWGDMILIQPALRAFHEKAASRGKNTRITVACNWMHNFPYRSVTYIDEIRPNILTLEEMISFDLLVNLSPANHQRSRCRSMKDLCLEIMRLNAGDNGYGRPQLAPAPERVAKMRPVLDSIRKETGRKLLCVNWKARFAHKNASPSLFMDIIDRLAGEYRAVLLKDRETATAMQQEIDAPGGSVLNLSHLIEDWHDTVAALSLVDAFVSVDTGIVHAAGAMGVPGVALFGPFPPETHVVDYRSVRGVSARYGGRSCKAPCLETHLGCLELDYSNKQTSPCFEAITADSVIEALEEICAYW